MIKKSSYQISKFKKSGPVDLRRKGTGTDFIGTRTRFRRGRGMAAVATDKRFFMSGDRLAMRGRGNNQIIDLLN